MALQKKCVSPFKEIRKIDTYSEEVTIGHIMANVEMTPHSGKWCRNIYYLIRELDR